MNTLTVSSKLIKPVIISLTIYITCWFFPSHLSADEQNIKSTAITGAGAHFAWVIFDSLKDELEATTGRKITLFGKNSGLGVGCNAGIKLAKQSTHNHETFGFVCCPLSDDELTKNNIKMYPLAEEPILILVNKKNPIENLSTQQVRSIFSGKTTNWKDVGGWDKPIVLVTRLHCKKRPGHWKTILPDADAFAKKRLDVGSAEEMVKLVTSFETSIGHIGATWKYSSKSNVKPLKINNVEAKAKNLKNKSYPFHRMLSAITNTNPSNDILTTIKQVQNGKSFMGVAKEFNLLPLNTHSSN
jgi:phosphate transport system substrate-binding protein